MEVALDTTRHLTAWSDDDVRALVGRIETGIQQGTLAVLGGSRGPSELAAIGDGQSWLGDYAEQVATLLDLCVFAFEQADPREIDGWAALEPASDPDQAERWVRLLRDTAPSFGDEWNAHVGTFDRVLTTAAPQVTIDPERQRIVGQLLLRTVVVDGASADPISDGGEAVTLTLAMTRNELLYLADRAQRAAALLAVVQDDAQEVES